MEPGQASAFKWDSAARDVVPLAGRTRHSVTGGVDRMRDLRPRSRHAVAERRVAAREGRDANAG